ncbi:Ethanolamine kinase 1-like protein [Dinothrombium tinctorium]|uniref:ethanolamine kinase n=1 Tax=Dinothrombium tinctorium TaxID=1965070 RepID=A0A3S3RY68_9ACAR|nr:Ethanolamine kinase 1-like protein [Dinothrombium tinctorium]RWS10733.1 Ethanolamine kinase 1-like protein [Dinothrombium tinctorium]
MEALGFCVKSETLQEDVIKIARHVRPEWKHCEIGLKLFTNGLTNQLIGCYKDNEAEAMILIRVYGENTHFFMDRKKEIRNMILMHKAGLLPPIYCLFENGICYGYIPGEILNLNLAQQPGICEKIAENLALFHKLRDNFDSYNREPCLFKTLRQFWNLIPDEYDASSCIPNKKELFQEINFLERYLSDLESPIVFCHNDICFQNIIVNERGDITFIDVEHADFNYQAFDIANYLYPSSFTEREKNKSSLYFTKEFQMKWLKNYLLTWNRLNDKNAECEMIDKQVEKLYEQASKFSLAAFLQWGFWALIQSKYSKINFSFFQYAEYRIQEYFHLKNNFLRL